MTEYTKGLLKYQENFGNIYALSHGEVGLTAVIAKINFDQVKGGSGEGHANARRIIACWNAMDGIPEDSYLFHPKGGAVRDHVVFQELKTANIEKQLNQLIEQNEKLTKACLSAEKWLSGWASAEPYLAVIRDALADDHG